MYGPAVNYIISRFLPENIRTLPFSFQKGWAISLKALQQLRASDIIFLFVFLYIIMGISLNMELSRQDMHLACKGLILLEVIFLILSGLSVLFHWNLQYSIDILFRWNLLISSIGIILFFTRLPSNTTPARICSSSSLDNWMNFRLLW